MTGLRDIKALDRARMAAVVGEMGQPPYRVRQLVRWLYARGVTAFSQMTDLPSDFRDRLDARFVLHTPVLADQQVSSDGTRKYLWTLGDGVAVESVGIPAEGRLTVCFSTQAGCAMGCSFCATGMGGLVRDLTTGEMLDQVRLVGTDFGQRITNAVAMGQGEPFANYDASIEALRLMNSPDGLGIGARHITVSTCGLLPGIERFAEEPEQFTLAVSLHSAVQATRDRLMPGVRGFKLRMLRETLLHYVESSGRRVTLEYALVDGVNDSDAELEALITFTRGLLCHINLIPVNPVSGAGTERPGNQSIRRFADRLVASGVETSIRTERGVDIDAACGQLSQRHQA